MRDRDERETFLSAVRDVKPLAQSKIPQGLQPVKSRRRRQRDPFVELAPEPCVDSSTSAEEQLTFRRAGVQERVVRRLRRGLIPIEADLDLHGLTQSAAWHALQIFFDSCQVRKLRCVRVVHGKGYRSGARGPVLKSAINSWLRGNLDVIAFVSARAIDGGAGAIYVLLRA